MPLSRWPSRTTSCFSLRSDRRPPPPRPPPPRGPPPAAMRPPPFLAAPAPCARLCMPALLRAAVRWTLLGCREDWRFPPPCLALATCLFPPVFLLAAAVFLFPAPFLVFAAFL